MGLGFRFYALFYSQVESFNTIFCGNNSCNVLFDKKKLEKICRKNCENQYYIQTMNSKIKTSKIWSNIDVYKDSEDIVYYNKPKMVLTEVLCSLGGLVSMWLGISLFDLISKCLEKIFKLIGKLESSKITINVKEKFLRLVVIFKYALILTFFVLMLYQIIEVINIYSEQQTIKRFDVLHIKTLPEIGFLARIPSKKLIKKLDSIYGIESNEEEFYEIFYRLLNEKNFIKFDEYFEYKNSVKSCAISIRNKIINCPKPVSKILVSQYGIYLENSFFANFNESYKKFLTEQEIERNLIKISFEFSLTFDLFLGFFHERASVPTFNSNTETNLFNYSYSAQKLEKSLYFCDKTSNDEIIFSDFNIDNCIDNCLVELFISRYQCLPRHKLILFFIDFEKYILFNKYKFCNKTLKVEKLFLNSIDVKYYLHCSVLKCNTIYFQSMIETFNSINKTKLNLIPIEFPHLRFIETFKLDMNGLIYNLGGVIVLWFGLSSVSLVYLVTNMKVSNLKKIISILKVMKHYLILFPRILKLKSLFIKIVLELCRYLIMLFMIISLFISKLWNNIIQYFISR
jgi:hypothetical protein